MARYARNALANVIYHVMHRGNNKQTIFYRDADYMCFMELMRKARDKFGVKLYSYALMPNHVHLLLVPQREDQLSSYMKYIAQKYSQYANHVYHRTGTLWEGRYKSSPVSGERYLLACCRYIEMNPVRANLAAYPAAYPWSSYRAKIGCWKDGLLDPDAWYESFGSTVEERQQEYQQWFMQSIPDDELKRIRDSLHRGAAFGESVFVEEMDTIMGRNRKKKKRGRPRKMEIRNLSPIFS